MVHKCRNQNKFKFKELKKKGSNFFTKNKAAVLKKGVNQAEIIKDDPLDVQELLGLEQVSSGPSRASSMGAGQ
jgi:hypothetical protein